MAIRNAAKAIVLNEGKVLLNRCKGRHGVYYAFPGGGQNPYETMEDALRRECLEETGYAVRPLRFAGLYEEIHDDKEVRRRDPDYTHKIYHFFLCELAGEAHKAPTETDSNQIGYEWVDVNQPLDCFLAPEVVGERLQEIIECEAPIYFGVRRM